ncbi:MAG: terminase small subunit [Clostridium sp.]|nr:terminase small subunit [Clostridium sp.]
MARAPDPRAEQAEKLFREGKKLIEIAETLGVPEGTVRSWKNRYNWDDKSNATLQNKKRNVAKKINTKNKAAEDAVNQVMENTDLTDKQRLFCVLYVRSFNATKAYQKAYRCSYETAMVEGWNTLRNPKIRDEISRLKQNRLNREMLDEHDIFQKYMDIAFADITDFVEFGREKVPVMGAFGQVEVKDPDTGKKVPLMQEINTIRFRESSEVDGSLISEVKQGKNGASVKLADRMKALEWLAAHMDLATEEQRAKISLMKLKAGGAEEEELPDDGFLEALKGSAASDWEEMAGGTEHEKTSGI